MMILQTLRWGPLHGYGLAQAIKRTSDELVHVEDGSLYPALQRMLKSGWLSAEWGTSARNREVRIYKLTAAGREQLEHIANGWMVFRQHPIDAASPHLRACAQMRNDLLRRPRIDFGPTMESLFAEALCDLSNPFWRV